MISPTLMYKINTIFPLVCMMTLSVPLNAQSWSTGFFSGVNFSDARHSYRGTTTQGYTRPVVGVFVERNFVSWIGYRGELLWIRKKADARTDSSYARWSATVIEAPLLMVLQSSSDYWGVSPIFYFGVKVGYAVKTHYIEKNGNATDFEGQTGYANRWSAAGELGAAIDYAISPKLSVDVAFRFSLGLTDMDPNEPRWSFHDRLFTLGVKFKR